MRFELKDDNTLQIEPIEFMYPTAETDWDKNWIRIRIIISAGKFNGDYFAEIMTIEFEELKQGFQRLYNDLGGEFKFESREGHLNLRIKGDGIGHFDCVCQADDDPGIYGTVLKFSIHFDQTQIYELVNQLDLIMKTYPIIGDLKPRNE